MIMSGVFGRKKKKWDGTDAIDDPMDGVGAGVGLPQEAIEQPQKQGFFAQGGAGRGIAGTIGDVLLQHNGLAPMYAPVMQQRANRQFAEQQYERKRTDEFQDAMKMAQFKAENPTPTALQRDHAYFNGLDDAGKQGLAELYDMKTPKFVTGADGRPYQMGRGNSGGAYGGEFDAQPTTEDGMDYTPGPGGRANPANWSKGGGAGNSASNFRR